MVVEAGHAGGCDRYRHARGGSRAIEPSVALHVPITALREIAASGSASARAVGSLPDFTIAIAVAPIGDLLIPDSDRRLAAVVLRSAGVDMHRPGPAPATLGVRQSEMANLSERMVNRLLKRFAVAGWIAPSYGGLTIINPRALHAFAANE